MKFVSTSLLALFLVGCNELSTVEISDSVKTGTVLISNESENNAGMGTGFILNDNEIITNSHVVSHTGKVSVYSVNSEKKYDATVLFKDDIADIAILKLDDWKTFSERESPEKLVLGNSDDTRQGNKIVIMGHPWGLFWTVSEGIISAKNRRLDKTPKYVDQVDAKLYQGNSGGPVFNEYGEVICVSNSMITREGGSYGFCIPSNLISKVLYDQKIFGKVRWRVLNVAVGLTEDGSNVIMNSVEPGGAAGMAGLKDKDIVLEIYTPNNHPEGIKIMSADDLITELASLNGDQELIKLLIERNGKKMMIDVKTNYKISEEYN